MMSVDSAENKAKAMKDAMQEPLFVELADQCLKIIEPTETENDDDDEYWFYWTATYGRIPNEHRLKHTHQISPALTALVFDVIMY